MVAGRVAAGPRAPAAPALAPAPCRPPSHPRAEVQAAYRRALHPAVASVPSPPIRYPAPGTVSISAGSQAAAEAADGDRHGVREGVGVLVPNLLEQVLRLERGLPGPQESLQHAELLGRELAGASLAGDPSLDRVQLDARRARDAALRARPAMLACGTLGTDRGAAIGVRRREEPGVLATGSSRIRRLALRDPTECPVRGHFRAVTVPTCRTTRGSRGLAAGSCYPSPASRSRP